MKKQNKVLAILSAGILTASMAVTPLSVSAVEVPAEYASAVLSVLPEDENMEMIIDKVSDVVSNYCLNGTSFHLSQPYYYYQFYQMKLTAYTFLV